MMNFVDTYGIVRYTPDRLQYTQLSTYFIMLLVGLLGDIGDSFPSANFLYPFHFCGMVGFERSMVNFS